MLFKFKKEYNSDTYYNVSEVRKQSAKYNKPDTQGQMYDST